MISIFDYTAQQLQTFLLILLRVSGILIAAPIFGHQAVPRQIKIGLALILSFILVPLTSTVAVNFPQEIIPLGFFLAKELIAGLFIGFAFLLIFLGVQMGGSIVGLQIGFGLVSIFDPQSQEQISVIGELQFLLAMLFFLAINGHHILISSIFQSFKIIPPGAIQFSSLAAEKMVSMMAMSFVIAIKIAAPLLVTLFLTDVALGIIARTMPQMNVFIVGFPLKIGVGLLMLVFTLPLFSLILEKLIMNLDLDVGWLINYLS
ncbi:MAG: flagellar type III secretion system protein FliR [candidate division Zixibacteria bacterium]|nr:flagellar type III secretion system protein FliR [candidate division Zixibacteria bacterium]